MKRIKLILAIASICCVAVPAGASANFFHASKAGTLKGHALNNQVFSVNGGSVTCKKAASSGTAPAGLVLHQLITVIYSECEAFFFPAHVTPAQYLFSADGLVYLENTVHITILGVCSILVLPQDLGTVKYKNSGKNIVEESNVTKIHSHGSGGVCGGLSTTGTYTGNNEIELEGGEISWL